MSLLVSIKHTYNAFHWNYGECYYHSVIRCLLTFILKMTALARKNPRDVIRFNYNSKCRPCNHALSSVYSRDVEAQPYRVFCICSHITYAPAAQKRVWMLQCTDTGIQEWCTTNPFRTIYVSQNINYLNCLQCDTRDFQKMDEYFEIPH